MERFESFFHVLIVGLETIPLLESAAITFWYKFHYAVLEAGYYVHEMERTRWNYSPTSFFVWQEKDPLSILS